MTEQETLCDETQLGLPYDLQPFAYLIVTDEAFSIQAMSDNCRDLSASVDACLGTPLQRLLQGQFNYWTKRLRHIVDAASYQVFSCYLVQFDQCYYLRGLHLQNGLLAFELEPSQSAHLNLQKPSLTIISEFSSRTQYTQKLERVLSRAIVYLRNTFYFDKAMVYQFDDDFTGTVVAESSVQAMTSYLGLKFPSTDIPKPARDMLCQVPFRYVPDILYEGVDVTAYQTIQNNLRLTPCAVSPVAPVHKNYLHNMGVGSSITLPIIIEGRLWGLLAFHHRQARSLSPPTRQLMRVLADHLELAIQNQATMEMKINTDQAVALQQNLKDIAFKENASIWDALQANKQNLKKILQCTGFAMVANGYIQSYGRCPKEEQIRTFLEWMQHQYQSEHFKTTHLPKLDQRFEGWQDIACGVYSVRLLLKGEYYLIFFRAEVPSEVRWAGDPNQPYYVDDQTGRYHPRQSFQAWREQQQCEAKPWDDFDKKTITFIQHAVLEQLTQQLLYDFANTDPLTHAYNRRYLFHTLPTMLDQRSHQNTVSVIMFDIDYFKQLNDTYGHQAGDYILKELVTLMQTKLRKTDFIARYGGEEFLAILNNCNKDNARNIADDIRSEFTQINWEFEGQKLGNLTFSAGVACSSSSCNDIDELISKADQALYEAKEGGRNRVVASC